MSNFIGIDGEAFNNKYSLIQTSSGEELFNPDGIGTLEALQWFEKLAGMKKHKQKSTFWIGFVFRYDVEMIFKDLPDCSAGKKCKLPDPCAKCWFFTAKKVDWQGYRLQYFPKKFLAINKILPSGESKRLLVIYDVFSFFNVSFIRTLENFLPGEEIPEEIITGKANRKDFTLADIETVREYNRLECELLVKVMERVAGLLSVLDVTIKKWHGPSAIAGQFLKKEKVRDEFYSYQQETTPPTLWDAFHCAFFGGRVEALKLGHFKNVFNYDINSAYPTAMTELPFLTARRWEYVDDEDFNIDDKRNKFSVWYLEFNFPKDTPIGLFPIRTTSGLIIFPRRGRGWYWWPEVEAVFRYYPKLAKHVKIIEGWRHESSPARLGGLVERLYSQRAELKAQGNPAEYAIKITLNSLYGKFAQKIGAAQFRCLPWAGYITSYTRAKLLWAVAGREKTVIGFATDGILTTKPLPQMEYFQNKQLGGWSSEAYTSATMLMSGVYHLAGEKNKFANRGHALEGLKIDALWAEIIASLNAGKPAVVSRTGLVGWKLFRSRYKALAGKYLLFVPEQKEIAPLEMRDKRTYEFNKIKRWDRDNCNSTINDFGMLDSQPIKIAVEDEEELIWVED